MAEKTTKTAPKTAKVFDIARPGKQAAPSATARPTLITNRAIMQDPMMTPIADATPPAPPVVATSKVVLKPLGDNDVPVTVKSAGKTAEVADQPDAVAGKAVTPKASKALAASADSVTSSDSAAQPDAAAEPAPIPAQEPKPETPPTTEARPGQAAAGDNTEPTKIVSIFQNDSQKDSSNDSEYSPLMSAEPATVTTDSIGPDDERGRSEVETPAAKAAAQTDKDMQLQAELEELVQAETYFVPLNAAERRRSRIDIVLSAVLILILAAALLEFMMDAGFVTIPGIQPFTDFF